MGDPATEIKVAAIAVILIIWVITGIIGYKAWREP